MIGWSPGMTLQYVEKEIIKKALRFYQGNRAMTAQALGISVKTIYNKLELYGLSDEPNSVERRRLQEGPVEVEDSSKDGVEAERGLRSKSDEEIPSKSPVPVREQKEIQTLPLGSTQPRSSN